MKVSYIFICFFLLRLQDGELGPVQAVIYTEMEGKNISVSCSFYLTGTKMYFCKKDCSRENILVQTTENRAQNGRYSIEFDKTGASYVVVVSITELKRSDSGWYRCGLGIAWPRHEDFEIVVNYELPQLHSSTAAATSMQHLSSSPSSPSSPYTTHQSRTSVPPSGVLLPVAVVLSITIIVLAAAFLVLFKRSKHKARSAEPSVEMEYAAIKKTNRVKTENREEEGENRSPQFQVTETSAEYSLASHPQNTVGEDTLDYSEVHISTPTTILHNSTPVAPLQTVSCTQNLG